jgi:Fe-S cluster assembly scaffold protein SufB
MRSLFWGVKVTDVEADANIKLNATISGAKINVSKIHKWISNEASTKEVLTVPCMINKQALKTGNELLLFQASNKRQRTK